MRSRYFRPIRNLDEAAAFLDIHRQLGNDWMLAADQAVGRWLATSPNRRVSFLHRQGVTGAEVVNTVAALVMREVQSPTANYLNGYTLARAVLAMREGGTAPTVPELRSIQRSLADILSQFLGLLQVAYRNRMGPPAEVIAKATTVPADNLMDFSDIVRVSG